MGITVVDPEGSLELNYKIVIPLYEGREISVTKKIRINHDNSYRIIVEYEE